MSGKLTAEQVRDAVMSADRWEKPMGNTGLMNTSLIIRDDGWQAIADELNATLGGGECENANDVMKSAEIGFRCSECGSWDDDPQPRFCHNCGRKVKR